MALVASGRELTYAELDLVASRCARVLAARGARAGRPVTTTLPPGLAFAVLLHAVPRLGAVFVPLDPAAPARVEGALHVGEPVDGEEAGVELARSWDPEAAHSVIHTSGTSGRPKPVELSFANHAASAAASAANLGVEPGDRWLGVLPLFHVGGLAVLLRSVIYATTAVLHERFDAERVRNTLRAGDVSLASFVPTMLVRLREAGLRDAPGLRAALLGGGPMADELLDWALAAGLPARPTYGMTETASQVVTAAPGERWGRPLRGAEIEIGGDGEILVRGAMVARGALAADGWLHTGDRGHLDAGGALHVDGRLKEMIVSGGENVSPVEVESVLLAHPHVADAGVTGRPDPTWGEAVTAYVVTSAPLAPTELIDWARERLAAYKVPKRVELVRTLPRNAAGKLMRDRLG